MKNLFSCVLAMASISAAAVSSSAPVASAAASSDVGATFTHFCFDDAARAAEKAIRGRSDLRQADYTIVGIASGERTAAAFLRTLKISIPETYNDMVSSIRFQVVSYGERKRIDYIYTVYAPQSPAQCGDASIFDVRFEKIGEQYGW